MSTSESLRSAIADIDAALKQAEIEGTPYSNAEMIEIMALRERMEDELQQEEQK